MGVSVRQPDSSSNGPADYAGRQNRDQPQHRSQKQRVLLVRLAIGSRIQVRRSNGAVADGRDVQHVQQQEQHQPTVDAGSVQLRRLPASWSRRSEAGAACPEVHFLTFKLFKRVNGRKNAAHNICVVSRVFCGRRFKRDSSRNDDLRSGLLISEQAFAPPSRNWLPEPDPASRVRCRRP